MIFTQTVHCVYLLPKYRQLLYYILLDALPAGKRIIYRPDKAHCPFCNPQTLLTPDHMFIECPTITEIWNIINKVGKDHFHEYADFKMEMILHICEGYTPVRVYHMSALWSIWRHWCTFMYDSEYDPQASWKSIIIEHFKFELLKRIRESMTVTQWLEIARMNRSQEEEVRKVPEKEFLLIWANTVRTNPESIEITNDTIHPIIQQWIAKEIIVKQHIDRNHHRPRLRFVHSIWNDYIHHQGGGGALGPPPPPRHRAGTPTPPPLWWGDPPYGGYPRGLASPPLSRERIVSQ